MNTFDFDRLILESAEAGASDIHIQTGSVPFVRIHGEVAPRGDVRSTHEVVEDVKSLVLNDRSLRRLDEHGSVDASYSVKRGGETVCRLRVSIARCLEGFKVVCRIVPMRVPTTDELGLPSVFVRIADQLTGMVVVAGVTGSGKSTTIAAMIERINETRPSHVITIEDPIEFVHTPKRSIFTRREIGSDADDFAAGLRTALRQDPDVILVGEMRDLESIKNGLMAAETGHLVFTTVHSETASDVPERIISSFPEGEQGQVRHQIADAGLAFIAQQLVPRADRAGRVAAFEILVLDSAARNLIRQRKSYQLDSVMQTQVRSGCTTMTRSLIHLFKAHLIDKHTLVSFAPNKERARQYAMEHVDIDTARPVFLGEKSR